jgi:hypothetical protein
MDRPSAVEAVAVIDAFPATPYRSRGLEESPRKRTPGQSLGRKATGPRLLRDACLDATKDPKIAELPKGGSAFVFRTKLVY